MIVNVNPYTTTFDENSHVMKFSAVATGVMTTKNNVSTPVIEPVAPAPTEEEQEEEPETPIKRKESRIVRLSMVDGGEEEDVIYEGEWSRA
jgi:kinesin family member 20